ncbi:MAG: efflux RND transporter periplasmic adaptor subunit, partial [Candidatus Binatia bacterium]
LITEGNLVNGGSGTQGTLLTTIVSLDPIYAYFEADERSHLKYARLAQNGERPADVRTPVRVALADEEGFPRDGWMDFVDNRLDPATGTMVGRAVLPNPDLLLSPGLFVRLRLPGSGRYRTLLLPDEAIGTDQAQKFVWVVDDESRAQYRLVSTGPLHDGLRIVRAGLAPGDRVVVAGVQRVRPGIQVAAEERATEAKVAGPTAPPQSAGGA